MIAEFYFGFIFRTHLRELSCLSQALRFSVEANIRNRLVRAAVLSGPSRPPPREDRHLGGGRARRSAAWGQGGSGRVRDEDNKGARTDNRLHLFACGWYDDNARDGAAAPGAPGALEARIRSARAAPQGPVSLGNGVDA